MMNGKGMATCYRQPAPVMLLQHFQQCVVGCSAIPRPSRWVAAKCLLTMKGTIPNQMLRARIYFHFRSQRNGRWAKSYFQGLLESDAIKPSSISLQGSASLKLARAHLARRQQMHPGETAKRGHLELVPHHAQDLRQWKTQRRLKLNPRGAHGSTTPRPARTEARLMSLTTRARC